MNKLFLYFHTLKYLRPIQVINRVSRKFKKIKTSSFHFTVRKAPNQWVNVPLLKSSYLGDGKFLFLNESDVVTDWNDNKKSKLWLYNLHYFDDLNQNGWKERRNIHRKLIDTWIEENPTLLGNGWEPYPISLRTVNWIKWFLSANTPKREWVDSLAQQVNVLEQSLEYHLMGNHLFVNAKALVFAGCYFEGDKAKGWLEKGLDILNKEIPEQILADGGNFELSPMYHNIVLGDMIDLYNLSTIYPDCISNEKSKYWLSVLKKMLVWAELMQHPDGDISFFNDSAIGIAPNLGQLKFYTSVLNIAPPNKIPAKVEHLKESGYIIFQDLDKKLIIDVAKVGPDYIPGHAHADTLSFELSLEGGRVFVNSGTSVYGDSEERLRQRKTEAHNTVVVDNIDSSEVWSGFRVAKRAYPSEPIITTSKKAINIKCSHNGYMHHPGRVVHTREWQIVEHGVLITDILTGFYKEAQAHYHLHPSVKILDQDIKNKLKICLNNGSIYNLSCTGADMSITFSTWHPEFGISQTNKKIKLNFKQDKAILTITREK